MAKQLYFVRHGQTQWNLENKMQGWADIPLNETGKKQAYQALTQLKHLPISRIFSSDLLRAQETAALLNTHFNKPLEISAALREFNYGSYEGVDAGELWKEFESLRTQMRNSNNNDLSLPGGETRNQVMTRVTHYLSEISQKYQEDHFMIISHGGVIYNLTILYAERPMPIENCDCLTCSFDAKTKKFSNFKIITNTALLQQIQAKEHLGGRE